MSDFPISNNLRLQRDLLDHARRQFESDTRVTGLILWGSIARGDADQFSDVDLVAVIPDGDFAAVFAERDDAIEAIGHPLSRYLAAHVAGGETQLIVMYPGPVQLDLTYRRASEIKPRRQWAVSRILIDREGSMARLKAASKEFAHGDPFDRATTSQVLELDAKFWGWVWNAHARIARGELWEALHVITYIRDGALLQMRDWILDGALEGYRRIESRDADFAAQLLATAGPCDAQNLSVALDASIDLYTELRDKLGALFHVSFDARLERHIRDAMAQRPST